MNSIRWGHGWQEVQISPWWHDYNPVPAPQQDYMWQAVTVSGASQARSLLATTEIDVPAMRDALEAASTDLARLDDHQIIDAMAAMLADGGCVLLYKTLTPEAAQTPTQHGPRPKNAAGGKGGDATVKSVISPGFAMPQRSAGAPAAAPAAPEAPVSDFASVDQDAQAAALVQAAADGVPFCEVCEKARREREAAGQAA